MKQNITLKTLACAAAVTLGLATALPAQTTSTRADTSTAMDTSASTEAGFGLLGSRYTGVAYDYHDLGGGGPNHAHGFSVAYNQPVTANFDFGLDYDWARANFAGIRLHQQDLEATGTYYTNLGWGKPFAQAGAGWSWVHGGGVGDDSFFYKLGAGVEFPVASAFTISPYVNFVRATNYNQSEFDFGAKAEYRVNRAWGIMAKAQYEAIHRASDDTAYSLGVNYHF